MSLNVRLDAAGVVRRIHCRDRSAELDTHIPHERLAPTFDAYLWMFDAMGGLYRALAGLDLAVPRPLVATYAPPGSLRRWLPVTERAVQADPHAADVARLLRSLVRQLRGSGCRQQSCPRS